MSEAETIARNLPCWSGDITLQKIDGGISNENFLISDNRGKFVARINGDVPVHGVLRDNDFRCNQAAAAAGIAPPVHHFEPGALVVQFVESKTLSDEDVRHDKYLEQILDLIKRTHREAYRHVRHPVLAFWPFQICRAYGLALLDNTSSWSEAIPGLLTIAEKLERVVGASEIVLGHNDMLAANLLDDGNRLWLIDWEYSGLTTPLFDLANLASNNALSTAQEDWLLSQYYDKSVDEQLRQRFEASKCISLLRETLWSMTAEQHSTLDMDFHEYTVENMDKFNTALATSGL